MRGKIILSNEEKQKYNHVVEKHKKYLFFLHFVLTWWSWWRSYLTLHQRYSQYSQQLKTDLFHRFIWFAYKNKQKTIPPYVVLILWTWNIGFYEGQGPNSVRLVNVQWTDAWSTVKRKNKCRQNTENIFC